MYDAVPRDNMLSYVLDFTEVEGYGLITSKVWGALSIRFQEEVEELHLAPLAQAKDFGRHNVHIDGYQQYLHGKALNLLDVNGIVSRAVFSNCRFSYGVVMRVSRQFKIVSDAERLTRLKGLLEPKTRMCRGA